MPVFPKRPSHMMICDTLGSILIRPDPHVRTFAIRKDLAPRRRQSLPSIFSYLAEGSWLPTATGVGNGLSPAMKIGPSSAPWERRRPRKRFHDGPHTAQTHYRTGEMP